MVSTEMALKHTASHRCGRPPSCSVPAPGGARCPPGCCRALWLHRGALGWMVFAAGMTNACFNTALATGDVVRSVLLFI